MTNRIQLSCGDQLLFEVLKPDHLRVKPDYQDPMTAFKESLRQWKSLEVQQRDELKALLLALQAGANPNATLPAPAHNQQALYFAVKRNNPLLVNALLEAGADVNFEPPMDHAYQYGALWTALQAHPMCAKTLLDHHAHYTFALTHFMQHGTVEIRSLLIEQMTKDRLPVFKDSQGFTPLIFAMRGKHEKTVEALLTHEPLYVNTQDIEGHTPLHHLIGQAYYNPKYIDVYTSIATTLISAGSDLFIKNKMHQTALQMLRAYLKPRTTTPHPPSHLSHFENFLISAMERSTLQDILPTSSSFKPHVRSTHL